MRALLYRPRHGARRRRHGRSLNMTITVASLIQRYGSRLGVSMAALA